jgi:hypothetical protein
MPGDTTTHTRDITLDTYRYLRGGMAVMIVMLGAAVIGERLTATCWQTSISAYYFTTAHSIFIAALCALGVQFIVYKGSSDTEDVLLTLAGMLAFIVAMVPTTRPVLCGRGLPSGWAGRCSSSFLFRGGLKFVDGVGLFVVGVEGQEGHSGGGAGDDLRHQVHPQRRPGEDLHHGTGEGDRRVERAT